MRTNRNASLFCLLCLLVGPPLAQSAPSDDAPSLKPDITAGKTIFEGHCSICHGIDGGGGRGPSLHRPKLKHAIDDKSLKDVIANGILPTMPDAWYLTDQEIANVGGYVKSLGSLPPEKVPGSPEKGANVYAAKKCALCHILAGQGNAYGPDLTEIGAQRGAAQLQQTMRHPAETIPPGFLMFEAVAGSGATIRGIRVNEDTFTIQLKDLSGRIYSLRKGDLKSLKKLPGQTPMPSYDTSLSRDEIQDLVAYLAAQRGEE